MLRKILIAFTAIFIIVSAFLIKTYRDAGELKTINPHFNGTVKRFPSIIGAEDITIDFENQIAYISADERFSTIQGRNGVGMIYTLDLKNHEAKPERIAFETNEEIHPHGISLYKSPEGVSYLYAVNHAAGKHSILLFSNNGSHLEKIFGDSTYILSPNDVLGIDEHRFYFTNDHGSHGKIERKLEDYLQLKKSNVIYFDGEKYSVAAEHIAYANGINMSYDGKEVYVSSTIGGSVLVFDRNVTTGKLSKKDEIILKTGTDNIELDESGNLWVACHPQLLTFVKHANDTSRLSPSQVFKITKDATGHFSPKEIYLSKGEPLSGSSVAAVSGNIMLIGSVMDNGILKCELK